MPVSITGIGSSRPMTPVEQTSICFAAADDIRGDGGHAAGIVDTVLAGAGVGVAGANDDAAHVGGGQAFAADVHRSGTNTILREDAGSRSGNVADDHRQITAIRIGRRPQWTPA